jgi:hypothetical protein
VSVEKQSPYGSDWTSIRKAGGNADTLQIRCGHPC